MAHRVIFAMAHEQWPEQEIDHINGNRADNRIGNLRLADRAGNTRNVWLRRDNRSGAKGVSLDKRTGLWRAHITRQKVRHYLGSFRNLDDAKAAYERAAKDAHGAFVRLAE